MTKCVALIGILLSFISIYAQHGARSLSLGGIDPVLEGPVSLFNNPAGIHDLTTLHFLSGYRLNYIPVLSSVYCGIIYPLHAVALGLSLSKEGDEVYNKTELAFSVAHSIGNTRLGIRINYRQYGLQGIGRKGMLVMDIGGITKLAKNLFLGATLFNPFLSKISNEEITPAFLRLGIRYQPQSYLAIISAIEKKISLPARISLGIEYDVMEKIIVRFGVKQQPITLHGGFGIRWNRVALDYGVEKHPQLGFRQDISIYYSLNSDEGP